MVSSVRLTVINDNVPGEGLLNEWGWSVLVDLERLRFLFDADSDPEVLRVNSRRLGIDLSEVDFAVLSHWHWDHYGGFKYLGEVAPGLTVYVPPGDTAMISEWGLKPVVINEPTKIAPDIYTTGPVGVIMEQAVGISIDSVGLVVLVGCSHPGVNVLARKLREFTGEKVYLVVGGFHSPPREALDEVAEIADFVSPAHCSGDAAKEYVRSKYPHKYVEVKTGSVIEIPLS
ncbi:MAG: MBL fold metallo-hydrolase [Desulfurococcales archaeon]|nr:MBL fold metallo-hydrolase [Desulfurococcales archaeon]